ncbi:hypothetical protein FDP41_003319 [Naegleria fowleri]|uniref:Uncharacterized protein n=1 Tax=Naegleria fowleri TaxID=5763 RepID=A0A6A5BJX5_NAEFO|nr:uncharacterized protein FDP41_003319 [Naegleria fowleri]KAF0977327.1 hypothetical protein FDP41_003319 [Naegleria fowleri]CAG4712478.1 unnamed protein product [Naegleria fowleri]
MKPFNLSAGGGYPSVSGAGAGTPLSHPSQPSSSNVGHDDLHPNVSPPFQTSPSSGVTEGGGSSQVGPHDPIFSGTHRPPEQHPHFDPVYPHNPMGDPIPDHQRVPHDLDEDSSGLGLEESHQHE